ncbi:TRAP transporter small permease [Planococcus sp. CPCC 101016]|uniref:TRAP transporter small permease n=1 Tax=Planococcus sp. CPCC 101016 TaxID=2599617 RepID=UPI0011B5A4AA|nr:TRAP transporter small permease [Planococcus sp. CPCC 101016]TWT05285.1 TRAP transporter small permease [Planococcus sp. CPCC 101016]
MIKVLEKAQMTFGVITLSIFFIAIIIQIVSRHMGVAIIWTEEVANYSFIWSIFMGAAVMVNQREHFSFDFLTIKLKGRKKTVLVLVIDTIILLFALAILYFGIEAAQTFWDYNWVALPEMKMGYVWISLPIMGFTMAVYTLGHLFNGFKDLKNLKRGADA